MSNQRLVPYIHTDGKLWDHYFKDTKTGVLYFVKKHNGKRIKFSTKETNAVKAKRVANSELEKRIGKKKDYVRTLIGEELDLFLEVKNSENLSYFTIKSYQRGVADIRLFWGDMLPYEITRDNLVKWYAWWPKNKPGLQMENVVKWMRNFCRYLSQKTFNGLPLLPAIPVIQDPNRKQNLIKRANKRQRIVSPDELKIIHDSAESPVEQAIVLFMYTMATRIDETLKLEFGKTVFLDSEIPLYKWFAGQNKADLVGQHALPTALVPILKSLRDLRKKEGTNLLFPQLKDNQKAISEQQIDWAGWRKRAALGWHWTPHIFRHTCLTNVLNDASVPQLIACKQYRVSPQVALKTYMKTKPETMLSIRDVIEVKFL